MNIFLIIVLHLAAFLAGYAIGCNFLPNTFKSRLEFSYKKGKRDGASTMETKVIGYKNYIVHLQKQIDSLEQQVRKIS